MALVQTITVDPDKVPSDQGADLSSAGIPLFYDLSSAHSAFWNTVSNGGGDIRVFESDGVTELAREVVSCDTSTETGELHFLADHVDSVSPTRFLIMADGVSSDYANDATYGRDNVWQDYDAVYHGDDLTDSSGNSDLTATNGATSGNATAALGSAFEVDSSSSQLLSASLAGVTGLPVSLQAWFNKNADTGSGQSIVAAEQSDGTNKASLRYQDNASGDPVRMESNPGSSVNANRDLPISDATWYMAHGVQQSNGQARVYVDGGNEVTSSTPGNTASMGVDEVNIGGRVGASQYFDGFIDEVRVRSFDLEDDWITTEYNNQSDNASFFLQGTDSANLTKVTDLTINSSEVDGDLTDYVVYLDGADLNSNLWSTANDDGSDIRIYKSGGVIELAREIVSFDGTAETAEIHFKYEGTLSSTVDTALEIYAGDAALADYAATAPYGRNEVWSDYEFVWHGEGDGLTDSSGNRTISAVGTPVIGSGVIDEGGDSLEAANHFRTDTGYTLSFPYTQQGWGKKPSSSGTGNRFIGVGNSSAGSTGHQAHIGHSGSFFELDVGNVELSVSITNAEQETWALLHGVVTSQTDRELYADGVSIGTQTTSAGSGLEANVDRISVGSSADSTPFGTEVDVDEVRIRHSELSANWISTEYNNQSSPSTFYTASNPVGGGGYTLELASGSITATGGALDVLVSRNLALSGGVFSSTGGDVTFQRGRIIELGGGAYSLTGGDLGLLASRAIAMNAGGFSLTGGALDFALSADNTDPNYSDVILLLPSDGTDASTTFTDESPLGNTVTAVGNAQLDSAQKKFGSASGLFDGTGDYLSVADSADMELGTGDATIEGWVRFNSLPSSGNSVAFVGKWGAANGTRSLIAGINNSGGTYRSKFTYSTNGVAVVDNFQTITTPVVGTWYHFAFVVESGTLTHYWNGVDVGSVSSVSFGDVAQPWNIGAANNGAFDPLNGWLDDIRITKGVARYTENFTPPTQAFPTESGLVEYVLSLAAGSYSTTGGSLELLTARQLGLASGSYTVNGGDLGIVYNPGLNAYTLDIDSGSFSLTGQSLDLLNSRLLELGAGTVGVTGGDLDIVNGYILDIESGTFLLTGQTLDLDRTRAITLEQGDIIVTGGALQLQSSGDISSTIVMRHQNTDESFRLVDVESGELAINLTTGKMWTVDHLLNITTVGGLYDGKDLPKSDPQISGAWWNDDGTLKVSNG